MNRNSHEREAQLRAISVFGKLPEQARVTDHGTAEVREGLRCIYEQDGRRIALDMPEAIGGSDAGPPRGYFGRAAICGCLAIGIKMTAARNGLHLDFVREGIEQHFDIRGLLAMEDANAAPRPHADRHRDHQSRTGGAVAPDGGQGSGDGPLVPGVPGCATDRHGGFRHRGDRVMEARLQTRVQRYGWDAAATHYHSGWEAQLRPAHDRLTEMAGPAPRQRVIEVACGS